MSKLTTRGAATLRSVRGAARRILGGEIGESGSFGRVCARSTRGAASRGESAKVAVQGRTLELSNLDKVLYPAVGFTKAAVIDYYHRIAPVLLPHLAGRALTLKRYPDGVEGKSFYEKNAPAHRPSWVETAPIWSEHAQRTVDYCVVADLPSLLWTANLAALELHVSLSRVDAPDRPTAIVFDLDPGEPAALLECAVTALRLRALLDAMGLTSLPKTSGRKGLQVYVPLNLPIAYSDTKQFAHGIARRLVEEDPAHVVSLMRKDLRAGKVFVDWSQNDPHKTTVSVYSLRAEPSPLVSAPVTWKEVEAAVKKGSAESLRHDARAVLRRIDKHGDLFAPLLTLRQSLSPLVPALEEYRRKRDFGVTREPAPRASLVPAATVHPSFMIHKHHARTLHYDLRLEMDGALASWAVPKGPARDPSIKRLAVQTEDHPLEYGQFEGRIPEGQYGAGDALIWDRGCYDTLPPGHASEQRKAGRLHLLFAGEKLQGAYHLIRTHRSRGGAAQWLLFHARDDPEPDGLPRRELVDELPQSVASGRRATRGPESQRVLRAPRSSPEQLLARLSPPMLATRARALPAGARHEWIAELKYDGFRALAALAQGGVALESRNRIDLSKRFPAVAAALRTLVVGDAILDGEIVALGEDDRSHFDQMGSGNEVYVVFDLLWLDGRDLRREPIETRRDLLESLLALAPARVRLSERVAVSRTMVADAAQRGFEGIVAKRVGSTYRSGRSPAWIKLKAFEQQELAIVGCTRMTGDARRVGALLLGVAHGGTLHYAGRVGTGFSDDLRAELLETLISERCEEPAVHGAPRLRGALWVTPRLVADVKFTEWTRDKKLRHPVFVRLRPDKQPTDCTREIPR